MTWEADVEWHAWADGDEPSRTTTHYSRAVVESKDGAELAALVVWQMAVNNDHAGPLWRDGEVIVEIVEPREAAGFYRVEIEVVAKTKGAALSPDDTEAILDLCNPVLT